MTTRNKKDCWPTKNEVVWLHTILDVLLTDRHTQDYHKKSCQWYENKRAAGICPRPKVILCDIKINILSQIYMCVLQISCHLKSK